MDNIPAKEESVKDLHGKLDRAQMLSDLRLMHCMALQKEVERLESERDSLISPEHLAQIEFEYDGRLLRMERELQVRTQQMEHRLREAQAEIDRLLHQETLLLGKIDRIYNSRSFRVTAPLRKMSQISRFWRK
ncbi:hypothetical protein ROG8370_03517 [Roseovarius gaetbuli]|uniref:Uncharacterized protein n=1 Tax=Roseovarius gaetbuli TaxID=1356575 RepID=A0A1X7A7A6_9RHOB|nr:hypothetical protein [Roseovarius gaetbuli]SLN72497.1 hypothetical protein ROG8370_03517 [Roseovarius gaetbuli]